MKKINFLFFVITIALNLSAQSKPDKQSNNYHIEKQLQKKEKIVENSKFKDAVIFIGNDSISMQLVNFKGKERYNRFLFCLGLDANDSIVYYTPSDIYAYQIDDEYYLSHYSDSSYFFVKQRQEGKINLYERIAIPSDPNFAYYFKFEDNPNLMVMYPDNPLQENYNLTKGSSGPNGDISTITYSHDTGLEAKFQLFIRTYLGDCAKIPNMINAGFYSIEDVSSIVNTYNNCFEEK